MPFALISVHLESIRPKIRLTEAIYKFVRHNLSFKY